jgi:hypothetical protein
MTVSNPIQRFGVRCRATRAHSDYNVFTVKTIATEIQSPIFTEIKAVYVALQLGAHFQWPALAGISSPVQSENSRSLLQSDIGPP